MSRLFRDSTSSSTGNRMRKRYHSPELRREAIRQVVKYRQPIRDVAEQLHLPQDTVRVWVRRHREDRTAAKLMATELRIARAPAPTERDLLQRMIELHLLKATG
ncbi:transposase [Rhodanobacter lindaniclasticus]|nr:transposase [Rhodanobacter lindaniclasticus]